MSVFAGGGWGFAWRLALACALGVGASVVSARESLADAALSEVAGQGLLTLSNTSEGGFDFTRIGLGADVRLNANFTNIRLGEYSYAARNGTGADVDIGALSFGRSDLGDAARTVTMVEPYIEVVYKQAATPSQRELVGARFGITALTGDFGARINAISGSIRIDAGTAGVIDSAGDTLAGKRWDGTTCAAAPCTALSTLGSLHAGDANGASRDFWVSLLKQQVQFPTTSGVSSAPAQAGFWVNWTDRLSGGVGAMPANLPKVGG